ncbi:TIGR01440 family protein [Pontibacillus yanchengensis]|uniref:TIGR01440 family protein n=1 Tax=Pontibacillus yanchengensis TaxID=462910 RepID=UPI001929F26F|nr:TIGR01440 family protein [Pontibacillus yanchengensis]
MEDIQQHCKAIVDEWIEENTLSKGQLFVIGCSTSEIAGERIGTSGSEEIAKILFEELSRLKEATGVQLAFQGCEHINRALVVEQEVADRFQLEAVSVIPVRKAGGSMAAYAFQHFANPVVVEEIRADAGIDIGDTFIGMHLKRVAVPVRLSQKTIGHAHVTSAITRPKLIGGERAVYDNKQANSVTCD